MHNLNPVLEDSRIADEIPLRPEQLSCWPDELRQLALEKLTGVWEWDFVPLQRPSDDAGSLIRALCRTQAYRCLSDRYRELLVMIAPTVANEQMHLSPAANLVPHPYLQLGATQVLLFARRAAVRLNRLDATLEAHRHILVPMPTPRGPNAAWVIRRGPMHPLRMQIGQTAAWYVGEDRAPVRGVSKGRPAIRFFGSESEAARACRRPGQTPCRAAGDDLLRLCGLADRIVLPSGRRLCIRGDDPLLEEEEATQLIRHLRNELDEHKG